MTTARRWTGEDPGSTGAGRPARATAESPVPVPEEPPRGVEPDAWRLPSGEDLISFALATGLAASPLAAPPVADETLSTAGGARQSSRRKP